MTNDNDKNVNVRHNCNLQCILFKSVCAMVHGFSFQLDHVQVHVRGSHVKKKNKQSFRLFGHSVKNPTLPRSKQIDDWQICRKELHSIRLCNGNLLYMYTSSSAVLLVVSAMAAVIYTAFCCKTDSIISTVIRTTMTTTKRRHQQNKLM